MSLWVWLRGRNRTEEVKNEIESHLRMAAQDKADRGESPADARLAARREFGNVGLVEEVTRQNWGWSVFDRLGQDLRYAARAVCHNPGFAAITIATMALAIGATTAVFSLVNAILIAPLPYPNASKLVLLHQSLPEVGEQSLGASVAEYFDYKNRNRTCRYLTGYEENDYDLTGGHEPERLTGVRATGDFFATLGVWPFIGRAFSVNDDVYGAGGRSGAKLWILAKAIRRRSSCAWPIRSIERTRIHRHRCYAARF
jgi:putative ABC transport system permease protein